MAEPSGTIAEGFRLRGQLRGQGAVAVRGQVEGRVEIDELLTVAPDGTVDAEVHAAAVRVQGVSRGPLHAGRIDVEAGALRQGPTHVETVAIEEGASFRGRLHMRLDLPDGIE
jgi:cytoskeletal protein CcmA (bactofilin family)